MTVRTLGYALSHGDVAAVEEALALGQIRLDLPVVRHGTLPLHTAAAAGQVEVIQVLLQHGAQVNGLDDTGITPLMLAIGHGHLAAALRLLEMGALATRADSGGTPPLHFAAGQANSRALIQALLSRGARCETRDAHGLTALHVAARLGQAEALETLCEAGADLHARDQEGHTPVLLAAREGQVASLTTLRRLGADLTAVNFRHEGIGDLIDPLLLQNLGRTHDLYWWVRGRLPVQRRHDPLLQTERTPAESEPGSAAGLKGAPLSGSRAGARPGPRR